MQEQLIESYGGITDCPETEMMKKKYGFLPTSIWYFDKSRAWQRFVDDDLAKGSYGESEKVRLSQFNPNVAEKIIKIWSEPDGKILDPFSGRCRALVAQSLDRQYTGYEISQLAARQITDRIERNVLFPPKYYPKIVNADSETISNENEFDLVFSCPPYWDVEDYNKAYNENNDQNLSEFKNYKEFLEKYQRIIKKCFVALKTGGYLIFVVNDIRREKQLIPFGKDTIDCCVNSGFSLHDIIINKINSLSIMGVKSAIENGYTPKIHEYILVFKKW